MVAFVRVQLTVHAMTHPPPTHPSLPYKVDTSRPSFRTNRTRLTSLPRFSRKRVLAATLSRRASAEEARGGLLDRAVDVEALARNTQMLASTLARLVPPPPPLKRFLLGIACRSPLSS